MAEVSNTVPSPPDSASSSGVGPGVGAGPSGALTVADTIVDGAGKVVWATSPSPPPLEHAATTPRATASAAPRARRIVIRPRS